MRGQILLVTSIQSTPVTQLITKAARGVLTENMAPFETHRTNAILEIPSLISVIGECTDYSGIVVVGTVVTDREQELFPQLYQASIETAASYSLPFGFGMYHGRKDPTESELAIIGADAACTCVELANLGIQGVHGNAANEAKRCRN